VMMQLRLCGIVGQCGRITKGNPGSATNTFRGEFSKGAANAYSHYTLIMAVCNMALPN
jgi:hypothetical protein